MLCVSLGDNGPVVMRIAQALINNGYPEVAENLVDGLFDLNMQTAVQDYQRRNWLRSDGIVGPQTAAALQVDLTGANSCRSNYTPPPAPTPGTPASAPAPAPGSASAPVPSVAAGDDSSGGSGWLFALLAAAAAWKFSH